MVAKLHVNWLELEASLKFESVRKRKEGPATELMVVVTPCFPLKVDQSVPVKRPVTPADDVEMVNVWIPFEVPMEKPPVAPAMANVWVDEVEPFNDMTAVFSQVDEANVAVSVSPRFVLAVEELCRSERLLATLAKVDVASPCQVPSQEPVVVST